MTILIAGLLWFVVQEWFKFVDHEKVLREGLERDLAGMMGELAELKLNTIAQVRGVKGQKWAGGGQEKPGYGMVCNAWRASDVSTSWPSSSSTPSRRSGGSSGKKGREGTREARTCKGFQRLAFSASHPPWVQMPEARLLHRGQRCRESSSCSNTEAYRCPRDTCVF